MFDVEVQDLHEKVKECNDDLNSTLSNALKEYYSEAERERMRMEMKLIDPNEFDGAEGEILRHHGRESMKKLLDFYGKKQTVNNIEFEALIPRQQCWQEYNEWKVFAVRETRHWNG